MVGDRTSAPNRAEQARELGIGRAAVQHTVRGVRERPLDASPDAPRAHAVGIDSEPFAHAQQPAADRGGGIGRRQRVTRLEDQLQRIERRIADLGFRIDRQPRCRASRPARCPDGSRDAAPPAVGAAGVARAVLRRLRRPTAAGAVDRDGPGVRSRARRTSRSPPRAVRTAPRARSLPTTATARRRRYRGSRRDRRDLASAVPGSQCSSSSACSSRTESSSITAPLPAQTRNASASSRASRCGITTLSTARVPSARRAPAPRTTSRRREGTADRV